MDHLSDLQAAILDGTALIVLGTGFTAASVQDRTNCSWPGLLSTAVDYLEQNCDLDDRQARSMRSDIEIGQQDNPSYLLNAATKIVNSFNGVDSPHFGTFLRHSVGSLDSDIARPELALAINALDTPVCTVNYDTVYEKITGASRTTWMNTREARTAMAETKSSSVLHLHGVWDTPESIVLTDADYAKIVSSKGVEAIRNSIGTLKTLIFVGFGDGLTDPHFESLWTALRDCTSGTVHYSLCRASGVSLPISSDSRASIIQVSYGDSFDDLLPFVRSLQPTGPSASGKKSEAIGDPGVMARIARTSRANLMDLLADSALMRAKDDSTLEDLVVDPVLLPVPPEAFAQERAKDDGISHLDPALAVSETARLVLIGEEQSGLTTALRWLAIRYTEVTGNIPIVIEYSSFTSGVHAADKALRKALRSLSAPIGNRDAVPFDRIGLFIDNLFINDVDDGLRRLLLEIESLGLQKVVFGCRPGAELRITQSYEQLNRVPGLAYLGPIGKSHATELARRIDPLQAPYIADRVLSITRKERLSRTPMAIILLIVGVANDDGWINAVSNTTFVDSFVDSLLGRGRLRDDMRSQVDSAGYSRVLQALSRRLIELDSASIDRTQLIVFLDELVRTLDWSERPDVLVRDLIGKGLLVDRSGSIFFRQSVYLHIFAARAAVRDRSLLVNLLERPLYYAQIIRHYAALKRDDDALVQWAFEWVKAADDFDPPRQGLFGSVSEAEIKRNAELAVAVDDNDNDNQALEDEPSPGTDTRPAASDSPADESGEVQEQPEQANNTLPRSDVAWPGGRTSAGERVRDFTIEIERLEDDDVIRDISPFPSTQLENAPIDMQLTGKIHLASNILRDSELVESPRLKQEMLSATLTAWGRYMDVVNSSDDLRSMITAVVDAISEALQFDNPARKADLIVNLSDAWSMHSAFQGISEELSTRKLRKALERLQENSSLDTEVYKMVPLFMLDQMHEKRFWSGDFASYLVAHAEVRAVRIFVRVFVRSEYITMSSSSPSLRPIEDLLVDFYTADLDPQLSPKRRGRIATKWREHIRKDRAHSRAVQASRSSERLTIRG